MAFRIPADGRYAVRVRDLAMAGSDKHFYKLTLGELPVVTAAFPLSVAAGGEREIALVGHNLPSAATVKIAADKPGEVAVPLDEGRFRSRGSLTVLVTDSVEIVEVEPNDQPGQATPLPAPAWRGEESPTCRRHHRGYRPIPV